MIVYVCQSVKYFFRALAWSVDVAILISAHLPQPLQMSSPFSNIFDSIAIIYFSYIAPNACCVCLRKTIIVKRELLCAHYNFPFDYVDPPRKKLFEVKKYKNKVSQFTHTHTHAHNRINSRAFTLYSNYYVCATAESLIEIEVIKSARNPMETDIQTENSRFYL